MLDFLLKHETMIMVYFFTSVLLACVADNILNKHTLTYKLLNGNGMLSFAVAFSTTLVNGIYNKKKV